MFKKSFYNKKIFVGQLHPNRKKLQKEMIVLSKKEEFEEAAKLRNQIQKLQNIISRKGVVGT